MGQLPKERVTVSQPFSKVGIDFAGPFKCKCVNHRVVKFYNVYVAIFVCFSTHAVHLEIICDLTSKVFINLLRRFIARRGIPTDIFSNNGTNFLSANKWFQVKSDDIKRFSVSKNFIWHFIPPRTLHHGGLWEAAVKSAKHHLVCVTNGQILNYEEYLTIFINIECIMNSHLLCYGIV